MEILKKIIVPIYVISLASEDLRRRSLKYQFLDYYGRFIFVDAIDFRGKKISDLNNFYKKCSHNERNPLTPTEVACSLSHVKTLKLFLETTHERCVILEDDVMGCDTDISLVLKTMQTTNRGLFVLGGQEGMKNSRHLCGYKGRSGVYKIPRLARLFLYRTCCYSVDRYWAQKIIDEQSNGLSRADDWSYLTKLRDDVFYLKILKHPTNLSNSSIQVERNFSKDNLVSLMYRNAVKIYLFLLTRLGKLRKVK